MEESEVVDELMAEFLVETYEGLDRLDQNLVVLEETPDDAAVLTEVFRILHTIKGTCGFLGLQRLERIAHRAENLLSLMRDSVLEMNGDIANALLATIDAIRSILETLEDTGEEGDPDNEELIATLERLGTTDATAPPAETVAPDGASTLISWGALNLTHRHSHTQPTAVVPQEKMTVQVPLNVVGHTLAEGHRWRIAVAPTYFPHVWTPPQPVNLTLHLGAACFMTLPLWKDNGVTPPPFLQPEVATPLVTVAVRPAKNERVIVKDVIAGISTQTFTNDSGRTRFPDGLEYDHKTTDIYTHQHNDPNSATAECHRELAYQRAHWQVSIKATAKMSATPTHFQVENVLEAQENGQTVFNRSWSFTIPRDLV